MIEANRVNEAQCYKKYVNDRTDVSPALVNVGCTFKINFNIIHIIISSYVILKSIVVHTGFPQISPGRNIWDYELCSGKRPMC